MSFLAPLVTSEASYWISLKLSFISNLGSGSAGMLWDVRKMSNSEASGAAAEGAQDELQGSPPARTPDSSSPSSPAVCPDVSPTRKARRKTAAEPKADAEEQPAKVENMLDSRRLAENKTCQRGEWPVFFPHLFLTDAQWVHCVSGWVGVLGQLGQIHSDHSNGHSGHRGWVFVTVKRAFVELCVI